MDVEKQDRKIASKRADTAIMAVWRHKLLLLTPKDLQIVKEFGRAAVYSPLLSGVARTIVSHFPQTASEDSWKILQQAAVARYYSISQPITAIASDELWMMFKGVLPERWAQSYHLTEPFIGRVRTELGTRLMNPMTRTLFEDPQSKMLELFGEEVYSDIEPVVSLPVAEELPYWESVGVPLIDKPWFQQHPSAQLVLSNTIVTTSIAVEDGREFLRAVRDRLNTTFPGCPIEVHEAFMRDVIQGVEGQVRTQPEFFDSWKLVFLEFINTPLVEQRPWTPEMIVLFNGLRALPVKPHGLQHLFGVFSHPPTECVVRYVYDFVEACLWAGAFPVMEVEKVLGALNTVADSSTYFVDVVDIMKWRNRPEEVNKLVRTIVLFPLSLRLVFRQRGFNPLDIDHVHFFFFNVICEPLEMWDYVKFGPSLLGHLASMNLQEARMLPEQFAKFRQSRKRKFQFDFETNKRARKEDDCTLDLCLRENVPIELVYLLKQFIRLQTEKNFTNPIVGSEGSRRQVQSHGLPPMDLFESGPEPVVKFGSQSVFLQSYRNGKWKNITWGIRRTSPLMIKIPVRDRPDIRFHMTFNSPSMGFFNRQKSEGIEFSRVIGHSPRKYLGLSFVGVTEAVSVYRIEQITCSGHPDVWITCWCDDWWFSFRLLLVASEDKEGEFSAGKMVDTDICSVAPGEVLIGGQEFGTYVSYEDNNTVVSTIEGACCVRLQHEGGEE